MAGKEELVNMPCAVALCPTAQAFYNLKQDWRIPEKFGREAAKHFKTFTSLSYVFKGKLLTVQFPFSCTTNTFLERGRLADNKARMSPIMTVK